MTIPQHFPGDHRVNELSSPLPLTDTLRPADQAAVADLLRSASTAGTAIYPIGGGTSLDYGADPSRPGQGLSLAGLKQVVDYPSRDMTITVEAGITIAELSDRLAAERQRLPVDVPRADRATVGGALATNASGSRRYRWGTMRDYVIGLRAVDGTGMAFAGGGRVVKNAAGYDLCRLLCGSLGTLAVVTQVTLMVKPMPEASALTIATIDDWPQAERLLADLVHTRALPSAIELLAGPAWREELLLGPPLESGVARLVLGLEGAQAEVDWMVEQVHEQWNRLGVRPAATHVGQLCQRLWSRLGESPLAAADGVRPWLVEAHLLPSAVVPCVEQLLAMDPGCSIQAHAGSGVVRVAFSFTPEQGAEILDRRVRPCVSGLGGSMVVRSRPAGTRLDGFAVWGPAKETQRVMQTIKDQFDPRGILNPGRFIFSDR